MWDRKGYVGSMTELPPISTNHLLLGELGIFFFTFSSAVKIGSTCYMAGARARAGAGSLSNVE